jgi:RHS repeat-associated protein
MATSGLASDVVTLPKGGGALSGVGETFSPDLFTGTGNFTVPIILPPGRNGLQPDLSLSYSSANGGSPFGLGWQLGVPGIVRKTSKGIPRYDDVNDTFILSGAEDLVPLEVTASSTRYQPRTEGLFARILHQHDSESGSDFWVVESKNGLVSRYGTEIPAEMDPSTIADPRPTNGAPKIFAWRLTETHDTFGNRIVYEYDRDRVVGTRSWDQLYLLRVRYAEYTARDGTEQFLVSVNFQYEQLPDRHDESTPQERRIYPFSDYRAGFEVRTRKRCTRIEVRTHVDNADGKERERGVLLRSYTLIYLDQRSGVAASSLPRNGLSLLSQIVVAGHDDAHSDPEQRIQQLPALEFGYSHFAPEERRFSPLEGEFPLRSFASRDIGVVDLFATGLPDLLEMNGSVRYWRNRGGGQFEAARVMPDAPGLALADPGVELIDADGDGRTDLLLVSQPLAGYFPSTTNGHWDSRSFQRYQEAPSFNLHDGDVRLIDLDGDGVTDAIRSGNRFECFFNDPRHGWKADTIRLVPRQDDLDLFPNVTFSDPRVRFADMSGDGMQDIVVIHDGHVEYWPNLGYGNWGARIEMRNPPRFSFGYDPKGILLGDLDGDGLADLVHVESGKVTLYLNQSGNGWSDAIEIRGTPVVTTADALRCVDLLGTGTSGVLWTADANAPGRPHAAFLDLTGGMKPYLLTEMDNHMGAITRVAYASSTRFYLDDQRRPETRWRATLPFPVQVVAQVEAVDAISQGKLTTEYRYHHGHWDGGEREFRGFGRVDRRDTQLFGPFGTPGFHPQATHRQAAADSFSPPVETRTWFHLGPIGPEFGDWYELDLAGEFWPDDPPRFSRSSTFAALLDDVRVPRRVKRDAIRALRGRILRTELYAIDGSPRESRPFTITEHLHSVREEAAPAIADDQSRRRIFFPHTLAARTTQWERGDDPMTQFEFSDDYDAFGQSRRQSRIACPRGWRDMADRTAQPFLGIRTRAVFAEPLANGPRLVDRVTRATTFEIENDGSQTVEELSGLFDDAPQLRLIAQSLNFYDGDAFVGLPFGKVGAHGVLVRSESLAFTEEILHDAYRSGDTIADPPEIPPYLVPDVLPTATDEYPQEFLDRLPPLAGYIFHPGDAERTRGYYVVTARHAFDFQDRDRNRRARGLLERALDPLGGETIVGNYLFELLPTEVTDSIGLTSQVAYDERVLQPNVITDPNGNRTTMRFAALGFLSHVCVIGGSDEKEGDSDDAPGTEFVYDLLAFARRRTPISVRSIRRIHHVNDTDVPLPERDATITVVEYSDGFGRLVQTRTQAEDITFGEPAFGAGVLPVDQSVIPGAAIGRKRVSAEENVVVSGWTIYDNKGRVIEQFEPFFDRGFEYLSYESAQEARPYLFGQKTRLFHDARGRVRRRINPDGSEHRALYGIPDDITDLDALSPTPWEAFAYDPNDLAAISHHPTDTLPDGTPKALTDRAPASHHFTPASLELDPLGRTVRTIARNGANPSTDWFVTRSRHDIRGNVLNATDALGREITTSVYDFANRALRIESIDAGVRRIVLDAGGNEVERRDSKGALVLSAYDRLQRPARKWAHDDADGVVTERQRFIYGDGGQDNGGPRDPEALNLLGRLFQHYDEAGRRTFARYDFKGNVLEQTREVIDDSAILGGASDRFQVDWRPRAGETFEKHAAGLLSPTTYVASAVYDGLNRIRVMRFPLDEEGRRRVLHPTYNRAGALERVSIAADEDAAPVTFVEHIAYDAKGRRTFIALGNGVMTRHAYDPHSFRLARLRTERYAPHPDTLIYEPTGVALHDLAYAYDLAGNILTITDRIPGSGVRDNPEAVFETDPVLRSLVAAGDALVRRFDHDPIYRLTSATGRECRDIAKPRPMPDLARCGFNSPNHGSPNQDNAASLTIGYHEHYVYDPTGNLLSMSHRTVSSRNDNGVWTRRFGMGGLTPEEWNAEWPVHFASGEWRDAPGNHLTHVGDDEDTFQQTHTFDANGNLTRETTSRHFEWDHSDRLKGFRTQSERAVPSIQVFYLYDAGGQRVKKLVRKQAGEIETTVYIDGAFEHHRWTDGRGRQGSNNRLHVTDDAGRVALIRIGDAHPLEKGPDVEYHLGDHLGSNSLVVDDLGEFVNREEFTPYGETSFGSFGRKRFRFVGQERDEETGFYYHGARYYAPGLGRWIAADPGGTVDGVNLYVYARDNPIGLHDRSGFQATPSEDSNAPGKTISASGVAFGGFDAGGTFNLYEGEVIHIEGHAPADPPIAEELEEEFHGVGGWLHKEFYRPAKDGFRQMQGRGGELATAWGEDVPILGHALGYLVGTPSYAVGLLGEGFTSVLEFVTPQTQEEHFMFVMTGGLELGFRQGVQEAEEAAAEKIVTNAEGKAPAVLETAFTTASRGMTQADLDSVAHEFVEQLPQAARARAERWQTIGIGLAEDDEGIQHLVYALNNNQTSAFIRAVAEKMGLTRWVATPRAGVRGVNGAPADAEQILIEAAICNAGFTLLGIAASRPLCRDCAIAVHHACH